MIVPKEEYDKLNEKFKMLENAKKMNDKTSKHELDILGFKVKQYERQVSELQNQLNKKQKEGNIIMYKLKEKERKNFNTLQPI